jgi:hypothetical protein
MPSFSASHLAPGVALTAKSNALAKIRIKVDIVVFSEAVTGLALFRFHLSDELL